MVTTIDKNAQCQLIPAGRRSTVIKPRFWVPTSGRGGKFPCKLSFWLEVRMIGIVDQSTYATGMKASMISAASNIRMISMAPDEFERWTPESFNHESQDGKSAILHSLGQWKRGRNLNMPHKRKSLSGMQELLPPFRTTVLEVSSDT